MSSMLSLFRCAGLLSLPLFSLVALGLQLQAHGHSYSKHTVSKTILFLNKPIQRVIFRLNFVVKSLLDVCFLWYIMVFFHLSYTSPIVWSFGLAAFAFGLLGYFVEGNYAFWHKILVYSVGILWAMSAAFLAQRIGVQWFTQFTAMMVIVPTTIAFVFLLLRKTNVYVQALCILMIYSWIVTFTHDFL